MQLFTKVKLYPNDFKYSCTLEGSSQSLGLNPAVMTLNEHNSAKRSGLKFIRSEVKD